MAGEEIDWDARYARAQEILALDTFVPGAIVYPRWIDRDRFWYDRGDGAETQYRLVDAREVTSSVLLEKHAVVGALELLLGVQIDSDRFTLANVRFAEDGSAAWFEAFGTPYRYSLIDGSLDKAQRGFSRDWNLSPDSKFAVLLRDDNLVLLQIEGGAERVLTRDGEPHNAYGSPPASVRYMRAFAGSRPHGVWSPDGRYFFTLQADDRHVPELALADYAPLGEDRPRISSNRTALPIDAKATEFRLLVIEVETGRQNELRYPRLSAVRMNDTPFAAGLAWWSADSATVWFVDIERGEAAAHLIACEVATGAARRIFSETSDTYLDLGPNVYAPSLIFPVQENDELVWYSERSGYGHLYLYNLSTGELIRPLTSGDWQVREVHRLDVKKREIMFSAGGIVPSEDPYHQYPCCVSLDGGEVEILSSEAGEHVVYRPGEMALMPAAYSGADIFGISGWSPDGDWFVETTGGTDRLPVTWLRRRDGSPVTKVESPSTELLPTGWRWPETFRTRAADGETSLYGLLFRPEGFDPAQKYPVIDLVYGGPQISFVPKIAFGGGGLGVFTLLEAAHLAALGAFVVIVDGRGTANRDRAFRTASHRAIHTASNLDDHISTIRCLSASEPAMDLDRVAITGFSGGGYMSAMAALTRGDFFKVAVAGGGNYDQTLFWHGWGERYHGLYAADHYAEQAAKSYAAGLKGRLMLVHGLLDSGCHPAAMFQLVQALIEADKAFDLVILPRAGHDWTGYGFRRRFDYLVQHLFSVKPPEHRSFPLWGDRLKDQASYNLRAPQAPRGQA